LIEAAVVGQPDELAGTRLVAVATPRDDTCRVEDLLRYCAERLPAFKVPSEIRLIKSLPKNASGKIDRHLCETLVRQAPDGR
jgi:acyl-CoA synthetase (AMP-forming)/AMP-acid ligase II